MKSLLTWMVAVAIGSGTLLAQAPPSSATEQSAGKTPVLVELFTSEGCSSCPPADEMLANIRNMQPIPGENIIVLSEHVDYWDHDGWKDRFSSHDFTERQQMYAQMFKLQQPYTPEMIVDGVVEFLGSDAPKAQAAFDREHNVAKVPLTLSGVEKTDKGIKLHVQAASFTGPKKLDLLLAVADDDAETQVKAGENGGKTLKHVNVVRKLEKVTTVSGGKELARDVTIKAPSDSGKGQLVVAFLQDPETGKVWGASAARL
ncbi:MAG TPA: DUF1223 domain-containing protein [Candidatus Koribacter sp.]|jgi:hypothetical protein